MIIEGKKRCPRCGVVKDQGEFYCVRSRPDGLASRCKECEKERKRQYRQAHPEIERAYRVRNKERLRHLGKAWRDRDQDRIRRYRGANRERMKEYLRGYNQTDKARESGRAWRMKNPAAVRAKKHRRKERIRVAEGTYTANEWRELRESHGNRCLCCGSAGPLQPDHVVPLANGGPNDIGNIQPLCGPCNYRKGTQTVDYRDKQKASGS